MDHTIDWLHTVKDRGDLFPITDIALDDIDSGPAKKAGLPRREVHAYNSVSFAREPRDQV